MTITAQRAKVVGFSTPYFIANQGVLIAKGVAKPKRSRTSKRLQTCGAEGHDRAHVDPAQAATRRRSRSSIRRRSTAAFDAVETGRCEALDLDVPIIVSQSKKKPGAYGGVVGQIVTGESYGASDGEGQQAEAVRRHRRSRS